MFHELFVCPNCWQRWPVEAYCGTCGPHPTVGFYRHPPVDPDSGEVSAADSAILMGALQHRMVPARFRDPLCVAIMDDHGWIDDGSPDGQTVCPPWGKP
jgi:hypothetical protein